MSDIQICGYVPLRYNFWTLLLTLKGSTIQEHLKEKGLTLTDSWPHPQRRPLANFKEVIESRGMFLKVVNCEWDGKDRFFIRDETSDWCANAVQVSTENATVCSRVVRHLVEGKFPRFSLSLYSLTLHLGTIAQQR